MDVAAAAKLEPGDRKMPPAADAAIEISGLSLRFDTADGPVQALSDVSLRVARGEFVSFIGPSGCGKTTLLRAVADLENPTSGSIRVNAMSPHEARANRAYGYVFQAPALYPWRSVARNIALPLEIMGFSKAEREARVAKGLELVNLSGFGAKYPWQLSGGMQQRASIARALSFDPDLLLMDEPFGALDEIVRDMLNQQLLRLWDVTGKTVLFVTHSIPEAVFLSTHIVVMSPRPGRIYDVIECNFPRNRALDIRETPEFLAIANRVRQGLREGHSYDAPPSPGGRREGAPLLPREEGGRAIGRPGRTPVLPDGLWRGRMRVAQKGAGEGNEIHTSPHDRHPRPDRRLVSRGGAHERIAPARPVRQRGPDGLLHTGPRRRVAQYGAPEVARAASGRKRTLQARLRDLAHVQAQPRLPWLDHT